MTATLFGKSTGIDMLIVGLGNPGNEYSQTRHNAGFLTIDTLLEAAGCTYLRQRSQALVAETKLGKSQKPVALAKPQTFMNRSGASIKGLLRHYQLNPDSLLVVHDDLDIPLHDLRLKLSGGHGGHNGIRDINAAVGDNYMRVRIGIGRPPGQMPADRFVLQRLQNDDFEQLQIDARLAADAIIAILDGGFSVAQNLIHSSQQKLD
jgi:PTH1 family peptidyl-tRNA hydrolase